MSGQPYPISIVIAVYRIRSTGLQLGARWTFVTVPLAHNIRDARCWLTAPWSVDAQLVASYSRVDAPADRSAQSGDELVSVFERVVW